MRLVIGGAYQGKCEYAAAILRCRSLSNQRVADGGKDSFESALKATVIIDFQEYIRRLLEEGKDPLKFTRNVIRFNSSVLILMDEVGNGVVPTKTEERFYREMAGKAGQILSNEASEVHRVICGIGTRIK